MNCPTCKRETFAIIEMAVPKGPNGQNLEHAAPRPMRICTLCRAPWAEETSTAPAAPMPAAASPVLPAPMSGPKANGVKQVDRRYPSVGEIRESVVHTVHENAPSVAAQTRNQHVPPAPDYEAMMRAELDALDEAEAHIAKRRVYLRNLLTMLGAAPDGDAQEASATN